jgi:hypothetical protein
MKIPTVFAVVLFGSNTPSRSPGQSQSRQCAKLFLQSSELGLPPIPSAAGECAPHLSFQWERHTRWRGKGWGRTPRKTTAKTVVLFLYCTCVVSLLQLPGIIFPRSGTNYYVAAAYITSIFELYTLKHYIFSVASIKL